MTKADDIIKKSQDEQAKRTFFLLPILDMYILREFMIPFSILLFAFVFLFLIGDVFNDLGDFLEHKSSFVTGVKYFAYKMPGNIRFVLPISVLLACMYTLTTSDGTAKSRPCVPPEFPWCAADSQSTASDSPSCWSISGSTNR